MVTESLAISGFAGNSQQNKRAQDETKQLHDLLLAGALLRQPPGEVKWKRGGSQNSEAAFGVVSFGQDSRPMAAGNQVKTACSGAKRRPGKHPKNRTRAA